MNLDKKTGIGGETPNPGVLILSRVRSSTENASHVD